MDPTPIPASALPQVGLIQATFPSGETTLGSGTLVNPRMILTAGHVVFDWSRNAAGGYPRGVTATFGGAVTVAANVFRVTQEWINTTNTDPASMDPLSPYDIGAVVLDPAWARQLAAIPRAAVVETRMADLTNVGVATAGFPGSAPGALFWGAGTAIDMKPPLNGTRVAFPPDVLPGMSGGPVYTLDPSGKMVIRAVNTSSYGPVGGTPMGNGLLIYGLVARMIEYWLSHLP
jgi:V8-like Glu-specific endopeptidase